MGNTCFNCKARKIGCHVSCEDYKDFEKQCEITRKEREKEIKLREAISDGEHSRTKYMPNSVYKTHKRW